MSAAEVGDTILPVTRVVAVALVPILVVAAVLLFALPERSGELFAWQIDPPLSAAVLASAYVGGVWFFARVPRGGWHEVRHGFPAVAVFAGAVLIATLLHLDRFSSNLSFAAWMALYATTPFVVAALVVLQRRRERGIPAPVDERGPGIPAPADARERGIPAPADARERGPGIPPPAELTLPRPVRFGLIAIGLAATATGAGLFLAPGAAATVWAWDLTPLTAQVTGAVLTLPGVVALALLRDDRWSAFRVPVQAQLISLAAMTVSLLVHRDDLDPERWATPLFVGLVGVAIVAYAALLIWAASRARARAAR
ncbi:hypothetical protein [Microbacterium sp.]|uniref:hypothetical protein n=1 Tax=Microbacterium sp. TaxID=51671 RepID=UPI0039E4CBA0